jgi:hypothetical protein
VSGMLRGALIEYGSDFLGPLPNVVVFQFNPETLTRVLQIPPRPGGAAARETTQAGEPPVERLTVRAVFDAAELNKDDDKNILAMTLGVGPQIAALEQMVRPSSIIGGALGAAVDAIGGALGIGGGSAGPEQPVPRENYPRILFIWGLTRVLPVIIESMTITELQYDALLNPTHADVSIGLAVINVDRCSDDMVAKGALAFTRTATEAKAMLNLANTAALAVDIIPF